MLRKDFLASFFLGAYASQEGQDLVYHTFSLCVVIWLVCGDLRRGRKSSHTLLLDVFLKLIFTRAKESHASAYIGHSVTVLISVLKQGLLRDSEKTTV